jgi:enamine deaminase RidA (YjgF/YER057c/UK114 family)
VRLHRRLRAKRPGPVVTAGSRPSPARQLVSSGSPYEQPIGFSRAVRVGDRVVVAGTAPVWPDGSCDPDPERQAARCLEIITGALAEAGAQPRDVVRTRTFLTNAADWEAAGRAHGALFRDIRPASTMVVVAALLDPRWKVEIEAEAIISSEPVTAPGATTG